MSLKAPVVALKTPGPSRVLELMGIELDSVCVEARLPEDKLSRISVGSVVIDCYQLYIRTPTAVLHGWLARFVRSLWADFIGCGGCI